MDQIEQLEARQSATQTSVYVIQPSLKKYILFSQSGSFMVLLYILHARKKKSGMASSGSDFRGRVPAQTGKRYDTDHRAALFGNQYASKRDDIEMVCFYFCFVKISFRVKLVHPI